jgi:hypothetical protein
MQKRGQASPDDGDALALTFAQPVATWRTLGECERTFAANREAVGEVVWRVVLEKYGWTGFPDIKRARRYDRSGGSADENRDDRSADRYSGDRRP